MGSYSVHVFGAVVMLAIYWYFNSKVKTHSNYVAVYTILVGFLVYMSQKFNFLSWLITYLNKEFSWSIPPVKATSEWTMLGFGLFLLVIVWIYYKTKTSEVKNTEASSQKNTFKSWFNFGNVEQKNEK